MIKDTFDKVKDLISSRSYAYKLVFKKEDVYAQKILRDLAKFCRANESTFNADQRLHAVAEGRREVWLRIQQYLQLDDKELMALHEIKQRSKE